MVTVAFCLGCAARPAEPPDVGVHTPASTPRPHEVAAPWSLTASDGTGLVVVRVDAKAVVEGPLAFTELHLYFHNPEDRVLEGRFAITLPVGAAVSRFAMASDEGWHEAEVVPKQRARAVYEEFLHRKQDPALLETAAGNQFDARVFPIPARGDKHLVIAFSQEVAQRFVLPLLGLPKVGQLDARIELADLMGRRVVELAERDWVPDRDLAVDVIAVRGVTAGTSVIAPIDPVRLGLPPTLPDPLDDVALLVDTSASRALDYAGYVAQVGALIERMRARHGDAFPLRVIAFDQDTQVIYQGPAGGFDDRSVATLLARGPGGASDLAQALWLTEFSHRLVVVTDGVLTAGPATPAIALALGHNGPDRIDVVLAGGLRDERFARVLAGGGHRAGAVLDLDDAEVVARLGETVRPDIAIAIPGATWFAPRMLPAGAARPIVVYATFAAPVATMKVVGTAGAITLPVVAAPAALVDRAIARASLEDLEAKLALAGPTTGEAAALRTELQHRSVAARIISSQTAMLVLETDDDYRRYGIELGTLAPILVVGPTGIEQRTRDVIVAGTVPPDLLRDDSPSLSHASETMRLEEGRAGKRDLQQERQALIEAARTSGILGATEPTGFAALTGTADFASCCDDGSVYGRLDGQAMPPLVSGPAPLAGRFAEVMHALAAGRHDSALAAAKRWRDATPADILAWVALGEAYEAQADRARAARAYGSLIDLYPGRADIRRFAGERLERLDGAASRRLAIDSYRRAIADRPDHVTGHRLLAYALFRAGDREAAFTAILAGVDAQHPGGRFLGATRVLAEDAGMLATALVASGGDRGRITRELHRRSLAFATKPSTRFVLYWETDSSDVDFHIYDRTNAHAFYQQMRLASGGTLYADVTTGYGPECFTIEGTPTAGPYRLVVHYYNQGPMGFGMGLLQVQRFDGTGITFEDRPYVIMADGAYVDLGTAR